ncbi:vitamin K epoxide reductase family protein [Micromonospora sp. Llam7]|uniref:vitamin K epoxide reductase family protein n=1 Tax=Micromonospora tarapacensis TaxID=2835305 RepID=UPI001C82D788|nr:vitamin K epoxide reductase family protein [Micromonospora tarapacensis]MBX7270067.1 vitamin K epoxide reductase family protein [Micromonospora tarapacensis]
MISPATTAAAGPPDTDVPSAPPFAVRVTRWILAAGGGIGLLAALTLTIEKINLLVDPGYRPSCSINPILSCGSVMTTPQAAAFGFPNPLIGVVGFSVVTTVGVLLLAGVRLPRWWWLGLQAGATFGVVFVHWLIYQSLYRIGALCPYCMIVWVVTIAIFWYVSLYNLHHRHLPAPPGATVLVRLHTVGVTGWYIVILVLIGEQFWFYWRTLLA